jgi:hypothetical protein
MLVTGATTVIDADRNPVPDYGQQWNLLPATFTQILC